MSTPMFDIPSKTPNYNFDTLYGAGAGVGGSQSNGSQYGFYSGSTPVPSAGGTVTPFPGVAATPTPGGGPSTLTAQDNPDIKYALDKMKGRIDGDGGAGQAIDLVGGKLREASEGERAAAAGRRTMRGVSGSSIDGYDDAKITGDYQSKLAGAASDIALKREQDKDQIIRDVANTGKSQADLNGAERDRQIALFNSQEANQRAKESAGIGQTMAILDMMSKLDSMKLDGSGGGAPAPAPPTSGLGVTALPRIRYA